MSVQNVHTLICATCSRIRNCVSAGNSSCLSSLEIFPTNIPNPVGMREYTTLTGVGTLPNCFFDMAYAILLMKPFGCSIGGRNVLMGKTSRFILTQRERLRLQGGIVSQKEQQPDLNRSSRR